MNNIVVRILLLAAVSGLFSCAETPQRPVFERVDIPDRIESQQRRIDQGIASGELTRKEADMLQDNLSRIRHDYDRAKADRRLTREEWDRIEKDLDINSRMIQDKKNNPVKRLYPAPEHHKPEFESRIESQQRRIDQGIASGELTRKEADIVQDNLDRIRDAYSRMKSDGRLTQQEREKLDRKLDHNDKMIYNKKHNRIERID